MSKLTYVKKKSLSLDGYLRSTLHEDTEELVKKSKRLLSDMDEVISRCDLIIPKLNEEEAKLPQYIKGKAQKIRDNMLAPFTQEIEKMVEESKNEYHEVYY